MPARAGRQVQAPRDYREAPDLPMKQWMPALPAVGLLLSREEERVMVREAAVANGLMVVDLLPELTPDGFSLSAAGSEHQNKQKSSKDAAREQPLPSAESFSLVVTDEDWDASIAGANFPLVLRIRGAADAGDAHHPWTLYRPLDATLLRAQLQQAAYLSSTFAARHRAMIDELHRCRRIFDSVCNGITISDPRAADCPLLYVNPAFERMTGYTTQEVVGRNCRFLQGLDNDQPALDEVRSALHERREVRVLLKNYRKDGSPFWNELSISPILDMEGSLAYFVGIQNDVTLQVESARRLDHLASHDYLTGLANRAMLMEQLGQAVQRARRKGSPMAVLFFDLDNFKQVNDSLGHDAGDRLLQIVAARLRAETRGGEMVARMGGDEFVVVLEGFSDERRPRAVMRRLTSRVSEELELCGQAIHPCVSGGMALFPNDGETPEELLKAADESMYAAKHSARHKQLPEPDHEPQSKKLLSGGAKGLRDD